ncbi:hypothetical protein AB0C33_07845 [Nonomuraea sp. NPDC048881]
MPDPYWNHNVHYQRLVLSLIPPGSSRAPGCRFRRLLLRRYLIVWDASR